MGTGSTSTGRRHRRPPASVVFAVTVFWTYVFGAVVGGVVYVGDARHPCYGPLLLLWAAIVSVLLVALLSGSNLARRLLIAIGCSLLPFGAWSALAIIPLFSESATLYTSPELRWRRGEYHVVF